MKRLVKPGVVLAGYAAALLVACAAVYVRWVQTEGDPGVQASAGMYAFGDFLLFIEVLGAAAIVPTGLALWYLRRYEYLWLVISIGSLAVAVTGLAAAGVVVVAHSSQAAWGGWTALVFVAVMRTLVTPVVAPGFVVAALVAPTWRCRWILLAATAMEGLAGASWLPWLV